LHADSELEPHLAENGIRFFERKRPLNPVPARLGEIHGPGISSFFSISDRVVR